MNRALIYLDGESPEDAFELLDAASRMYGDESYESYGFLLNGDEARFLGHFDHLLRIQDPNLKPYDLKAVCRAIGTLHEKYGFHSILMSASPRERMLAPRVAMRLETGLVADVTEIRRTTDKLELIRPAYSGRVMAAIEVTGPGPVMLTVRSGVFNDGRTGIKTTTIVNLGSLVPESGGIRLLEAREKPKDYDIRESDVLISGGGGIAGEFEVLKDLARVLGGHVSASRAVVDQGIADRSIQVGQSGKTVSPKLYMALGINGAIQHVEGLKDVDTVISVNTNGNAPICSLSDIVVEGDAHAFTMKLLKKIQREERT
ncbi:MAG: electron transfer flavoprotein subunit alpha/FixB family protein [Desulfobacterales bacterium]|nr:electron transfer flavoprotein subunit alpha/FixB family protein [Desulfobacterales bacterium]